MTFESALRRLEEIVAELEGESLELARALALFEEGMVCLRGAAGELGKAEGQVQRLVEKADGTFDVAGLDG